MSSAVKFIGGKPTLRNIKVVRVTPTGIEVEKTMVEKTHLVGSLISGPDEITTERHTVDYDTLIAAATQTDDVSAAYADLVRQSLPMVKALRDETYTAYCGQSVTTRDMSPGSPHVAGHGSWVEGPDGVLQARYLGLDRVIEQLAKI